MHCGMSKDNDSAKVHAAICGVEDLLGPQQSWLKDVRNTGSNSVITSESGHWLSNYLRHLYGQRASLLVNTSLLRFFWHSVPRRQSFHVAWSCNTCTRNGLRPKDSLWSPSEEACFNPLVTCNHRSGRPHCLKVALRNASDPQCGSRSPATMESALAYVALREGKVRYWQTTANTSTIESRMSLQVHFPGFFVHHVHTVAAQDHTWIEVLRVARVDIGDVHPSGRCTRGMIWFWAAAGSGVWYNVGRSLSLESELGIHELDGTDPERPGGCDEARRLGYDSIQIPNSFSSYAHEVVDCRGTGLANDRDVWEAACPPSHVDLRFGVPAGPLHGGALLDGTTRGDCKCSCSFELDYLNCVSPD